MHAIDVSGVDLNLLTALAALLDERSVTAAARRLGLGQPATSHALARLRALAHEEPRARRRGVGRALMLMAIHAFAKRGATHVDLKVREENASALRLYRDLGMKIIARDPD